MYKELHEIVSVWDVFIISSSSFFFVCLGCLRSILIIHFLRFRLEELYIYFFCVTNRLKDEWTRLLLLLLLSHSAVCWGRARFCIAHGFALTLSRIDIAWRGRNGRGSNQPFFCSIGLAALDATSDIFDRRRTTNSLFVAIGLQLPSPEQVTFRHRQTEKEKKKEHQKTILSLLGKEGEKKEAKISIYINTPSGESIRLLPDNRYFLFSSATTSVRLSLSLFLCCAACYCNSHAAGFPLFFFSCCVCFVLSLAVSFLFSARSHREERTRRRKNEFPRNLGRTLPRTPFPITYRDVRGV